MSDDNQNSNLQNGDNSLNDIESQISELKENEEKEINESELSDKKIIELEGLVEELKNALSRSIADMQNFKRRNDEEKSRFVKFANLELLKELLPLIDNFDRSSIHIPEEIKNNEWVKGIIILHDEFLKTLDKIGVRKIKTIGEKLDPNIHEGLMTGSGEKDIIIEEFEAGYMYNNEIIKPARVKVGNGEK